MRKIFILISFLLICFTPFIVKAWTTLGVGQTVAGGGITYLLQEDFEYSDASGTQIVSATDTQWTGTGTDALVLSTSQSHGGSKSLLVDYDDTVGTNQHNKAIFTEVTSGKFTIEYWVRTTFVGDTNNNLLWIYDNTSQLMRFYFNLATVKIYNGSWLTSSNVVSANTWYKFEIEIDLDSDTASIWLGDGTTQTLLWEDITVENTGLNPDNVDVYPDNADEDAGTDVYIDDIAVYSGARITP